MRKNMDICYTSFPAQWAWVCGKCGYRIVTSDERLSSDPELQVFA